MRLNTYKNYRICPECGQILPLARDYFKRLTTVGGKEAFHKICKNCEKELYIAKQWKDGKLLCHECGEYKDVSCFGRNPDMKLRDCHNGICRECLIIRKKRIEPNKSDDLKLKQILILRYHSAKERSEKHGYEFNLTVNYLIELWHKQNGICALSGILMTIERYNGRVCTNVSIDKINREEGYIIGNVLLVCMACNQIKSDLSDDEMYYFCKQIVKTYEDKNKEDSK